MKSLVANYAESSSDGEDEAPPPPPTTVLSREVVTAPVVYGAMKEKNEVKAVHSGGAMVRNAKADVVLAKKEGPEHPYRRQMEHLETGAVFSGGAVERAAVEDWSFDEQFHTYQSYGFAMDATGGNTIIGTEDGLKRALATGAETVSTTSQKRRRGPRQEAEEDFGDEDEHGIWAPTTTIPEDESTAQIPVVQEKERRGYDQNEDFDRRDERKVAHLLPPRHTRDTKPVDATSEFHGAQETDYQGRSWLVVPGGLQRKVDDGHECFLPKKCVHEWRGHTKGIQTMRLFPKTGHLLLSGSFDGSCKVWDFYNKRELKRTYNGHAAAVRDVTFGNDGRSFASTGFDRYIRVWDVETGSVLHTFSPNRKMSFCVDFYPQDDKILLAGASDNRIYQYDLRTESIVQEYNHHLQAVNSVTFVDDDRRFVSTADDKKIFIWEYGIPVPIKYISEPHLASVPVVEMHPSTNFWCGQSLDNQIVTYQARDKMKQLRKKSFRGHTNLGYACGLTFSPNGKFLASGDGEGRLVIWDFKSMKLLRKLHCHDNGPCSDVLWHPIDPSAVLTAGWDSIIKLWE